MRVNEESLLGYYVTNTFSLKISFSLRSGRSAMTKDKSIVAVCFVHDSEVGQGLLAAIHRVWQSGPACGKLGHMKTPELADVGWLGPRYEMDSASHRFGKCSQCHEIICVEKAVTDSNSTGPETTELLYKLFRAHVKLMHSEDSTQSAA